MYIYAYTLYIHIYKYIYMCIYITLYIQRLRRFTAAPCFLELEKHNKRQELSATLLVVRGTPEESEKNRAVDGSFHDILATCWVHW